MMISTIKDNITNNSYCYNNDNNINNNNNNNNIMMIMVRELYK